MAKYNFETRELVPYREDWNRGGNVKITGALWYIKEKDGLYLKIDEDKIVGKMRLTHDYCVAKGLPAALLAQGDELVHPYFNFMACYLAYFKEIFQLFPQKPTHDILTILEDWAWTLQQAMPLDHNSSGYIDNYAMMRVAVFLRDLTNPYLTENLNLKINHNFYYTCTFSGKSEAQIIYSRMPEVENRTEAPFIYVQDLGKKNIPSTLQADGFMAAVINLAIFYHWRRRWSEFNFYNLKFVERINKAYQKQEAIIDIADLHRLSFELPLDVEDICKAYMDAFEPIMRKVWKMNPKVQLECIEGDYIYTYIYAHEAQSPDRLYASELYANLTNTQKQILVSYHRRFMEWLVKTYPITTLSQFKVMQAIAKDMPPIQLTIQSDIKVTHAGEDDIPKKKPAKPKVKTTTKVPKAKVETICPYINGEELAKKGIYTVDDFQKKLRHACEQEAKVLVDFLIEHEKYGNLDFHGANMKAIYITLRSKCFPTMRDYSYQNFAGAWKDALKHST